MAKQTFSGLNVHRLQYLGVIFALLLFQGKATLAQANEQTHNPSLIYLGLPGHLVPVARFETQSQQFKAPGRSLEEQQILSQSLEKGPTELPMLLNGELKNYFQRHDFVASTHQCVGSGRWSGSYQNQWTQPLLAFGEHFPGIRNYAGNYPPRHFNATALKYSRLAYKRRKIASKQMRIVNLTAFSLHNGQRTFFAVSSEISGSKSKPGCGDHSLLLLVEKVGRRYITRHERYQHNKNTCLSHHFISSFTTGQKIDHILIMSQSKDAQWFDILKYQPTSFQQIYHGGGYKRNCQPKQAE